MSHPLKKKIVYNINSALQTLVNDLRKDLHQVWTR